MNNTHKASLGNAPLLVEMFRGHFSDGTPIVECQHRGLISIVSGVGESLYSCGDGQTPTHLRSTAKPLQVLPLLELGFFDQELCHDFRLSDLALMMGSHAGQDIHTSRVVELIQTLGLKMESLRCGIHPPQDEETRKVLIRNQLRPSAAHNNCSGKHLAMLKVSLFKGFDIDSYESPKHPLQRWIKKIILTVTDLKDDDLGVGIDGCSLPTYAIPLEKIALVYARLAYWQQQLPSHKPIWLSAAFKKIWEAATRFPEYVAGDHRFDTVLMRSTQGQIFSKTGADGVHALSILPCERFKTGLGIAIKIVDGDARQTIRPLIIKHLLNSFGFWPSDPELEKFLPTFKNYQGVITGGALLHSL